MKDVQCVVLRSPLKVNKIKIYKYLNIILFLFGIVIYYH